MTWACTRTEQLGAPGLTLALVNEFLTGTFERVLHGMYLTKLLTASMMTINHVAFVVDDFFV